MVRNAQFLQSFDEQTPIQAGYTFEEIAASTLDNFELNQRIYCKICAEATCRPDQVNSKEDLLAFQIQQNNRLFF